MHLTPACGASESETIVRSKGLLTQMLSDEPVMPRELDFYRKGPQKCLRGRPTARYSDFNLGQRHCRTASAAAQERSKRVVSATFCHGRRANERLGQHLADSTLRRFGACYTFASSQVAQSFPIS